MFSKVTDSLTHSGGEDGMWTRQGRRRSSAAVFQVDDSSGGQKEKHLQGDLERWVEKGGGRKRKGDEGGEGNRGEEEKERGDREGKEKTEEGG